MNFGAEWPWWWNVLMQIGGFFEMTAPFGIVAFGTFYYVAVIDGNGRVSRRIRKWWYAGIEESGE